MLIDDFSTGKKSGAKLTVSPPPQRSLRLDSIEDNNSEPLVHDVNDETVGSSPVAIPVETDQQIAPELNQYQIEPPNKSSLLQKISSKKLVLIGGVLVLVVIGSSLAAFTIIRKDSKPAVAVTTEPTPAPTPTEPPKPTTVASKLSGVQVPPEKNDRRVTAIMIENSPDARPQAGLLDAGVVFEAIAEGGITRFLALYQEGTPDYIGPVRSVRPYYLDFFTPFDAAIAHVGGSLDALLQLKNEGIKDLDQFQNSGAYQRVSNREAPHNVYTSTVKLDVLQDQKGYKSSSFTSWPRKTSEPSATPNATSLDFNISAFLYNPHFDWDKEHNRYTRSQGGAPHTDERTTAPLTPTTVIALVMGYETVRLTDGYRSEYKTTGSGPMYVFQDGIATKGTWSKSDRKSMFTFTNLEGKPIALNPGQTWISIVDEEAAIAFK